MMKDNGGYAFPHDVEERSQNVYGETKTSNFSDPGMTLRDYFAAKAMAAIVDVRHNPELFANHAYKVADAMIEARKK